jgi:hypothetical protein
MDYFSAILFTGIVVGIVTWRYTKTFIEQKYARKWTLEAYETVNGWQALLRRNSPVEEYVFINDDNIHLISTLAYIGMIENMVNGDHGRISYIKKDENVA